jgi:hypothetical protein
MRRGIKGLSATVRISIYDAGARIIGGGFFNKYLKLLSPIFR